jgi:hypothetical protein
MRRLKLSPGSAAIIVRCALQKALIQKRQALVADPDWNEQDGERDTLVLTTARCGIKAADEQAKEGPVAATQAAVATVSDNEPRTPRAVSKLTIPSGTARAEGRRDYQRTFGCGWVAGALRAWSDEWLTRAKVRSSN